MHSDWMFQLAWIFSTNQCVLFQERYAILKFVLISAPMVIIGLFIFKFNLAYHVRSVGPLAEGFHLLDEFICEALRDDGEPVDVRTGVLDFSVLSQALGSVQ